MAMTSRRSQWDAGATATACPARIPSGDHSTYPPSTDRAAEADPLILDRSDSSGIVSVRAYALVDATVNAARPEADDAMPAPVGKELRVATRNDPLRRAQRRTRSRCESALMRND